MKVLERESSGRKYRYNLVMAEKDFEAVRKVAESRGVTVVNIIRRSIELGLLVEDSLEKGGKLIKREGDRKVELIII